MREMESRNEVCRWIHTIRHVVNGLISSPANNKDDDGYQQQNGRNGGRNAHIQRPSIGLLSPFISREGDVNSCRIIICKIKRPLEDSSKQQLHPKMNDALIFSVCQGSKGNFKVQLRPGM
jgi:hypothetical protein